MSEQPQKITVETVLDMWEKDCVINHTQLTHESLKTPQLHSKYLGILMSCKSKIIKLDNEYRDMRYTKFRYYRGEMTKDELTSKGWDQYQGVKPLKSDMESFLDGDNDLLRIKQKIEYYGNMIYQLESIMKQISSRDWQIRNAIENQKFLAGS